ncbi:hypothetical protein CONPUDRAFT_28610, partial [Coniophora puteana RWD-64-598 SS2]
YDKKRTSFMQENLRCQSITSSLCPINNGKWSELAYIADLTKFFHAVAHNKTEVIAQIIADSMGVNYQDH